jgi:hypothetical protein
MADKKISALTASATPLAGTEVLPIVQGGATVKVAVSDLTAGRAVSATQVTLSTGNLVISSAAKGVDNSAATQNIASTGTVNFSNFSGFIFVCNHATGSIAIFSCAAGFTASTGTLGTTFGAMAYNAGINGYTFTNNTGSAADFTFLPLRLRPNA